MLRRLAVALLAAGALSLAGCADVTQSEPSQLPSSTSSAAVSAAPPGRLVAGKADEIGQVLNAGCGNDKAFTCPGSADRIKLLVKEARAIMDGSARPEYYREAFVMADRMDRTSDPTEVRGLALEFVRWIAKNPSA